MLALLWRLAYSAQRTEHESEEDPWSRPASGEGIATTVVVEEMATLQLHFR